MHASNGCAREGLINRYFQPEAFPILCVFMLTNRTRELISLLWCEKALGTY
ncbi:hypothetical protein COMA2_40055 [Candidatus Nitrospira nitrificans]|uniref:Uncharacterized protein n=1 Tax=Candidatus Nitrospira nitrificans TaxID=1742973 RepID=A0A0S4LK25_9BACT|nr:hypothetical protein COMA2_40055 [Candidatus Nitrospira nitrificans]